MIWCAIFFLGCTEKKWAQTRNSSGHFAPFHENSQSSSPTNSRLLWQTYTFPWQKSSNSSGWPVKYTRPKADVKNKIDHNWLMFFYRNSSSINLQNNRIQHRGELSWLVNQPPCTVPPPARNKALLRAYQLLISPNKALLTPYVFILMIPHHRRWCMLPKPTVSYYTPWN